MAETYDYDLRVLVLAPFGKDASLIAGVLEESNIPALAVEGPQNLATAVAEGAGAAIISEEVLHANETIPLLAEYIGAQPAWSDLPVIVLTGGGQSTAATEFAVRACAPLGNVSLLERPLRPATLISAVRSAIAARRKQYEIRDHLLERQRAEKALRRAHDALESLVEQRTAALRLLSARLLRVQDEERRRIARELHDSLGQYLAGLKIAIELLGTSPRERRAELLTECGDILEKAIAETRTLSHLLHPPLLDEAGFSSAASWFVNGFSKRSGIPVALDLPPDLPRLPQPVEIALFRILQESLTNVHRHSRAPSAEIKVEADAEQIVMEIIDHGRGMPRQVLDQLRGDGTKLGVGLAGMRERVHELGGEFEVTSGGQGTTVTARIPLAWQGMARAANAEAYPTDAV